MKVVSQDLPEANQQPVFVLGNPRSGTTLFRLVLTAHSKIGIPPESEFIVGLFPRYGSVRKFDDQTLDAFIADLGGGRIDLANQWKVELAELFGNRSAFLGLSYPQVCAQLYRNYQAVLGFASKIIWGDKNNAYGNYVDVINFLYPHARYLHLVRDGRAVLNSYKKLNIDPSQRHAPILPKEARTVAQQWVDMTARIERHLARFARGRHCVVRYEDLLRDFDAETSRICDFLGIEYESDMRHFDELNRKFVLEPSEYKWKENTFKPLDPAKMDAWRTELNAEDIKVFEQEAGPSLVRNGYSLLSDTGGRPTRLLPSKIAATGRLREAMRAGRLNAVRLRAATRI